MPLSKELVVLLLAFTAVALGQVGQGGSRKAASKSLLKKYLQYGINKELGRNDINSFIYPKPINPKKSIYYAGGKMDQVINRINDLDYVPSSSMPAPTLDTPPPISVTGQPSPSAVGATQCQTAEQWEGRASEWDHIQGVNNRFNITFDGTHRRKRIVKQLPGNGTYEYIMLYDEGIQYVINHNYNICTVEKLGAWRNYTIPPNSTLVDFYEIGAPGSGFMVQEWSDRTPGKQNESRINTNTYPGCWPMTEVLMKKDEQNRTIQSVSTRFFDLHSGIKNMSVFTPPAFCMKAQSPIIDTEQSSVPVMSGERTGESSDGDTVFYEGSGEEGSGEESLESGSGEQFDGILKI